MRSWRIDSSQFNELGGDKSGSLFDRISRGRWCPSKHHHVVQSGVLQEQDVLAVFAQRDIQGVVRVHAAAAALEAVDVRTDRADVSAVLQSVDANEAVAVGNEDALAC